MLILECLSYHPRTPHSNGKLAYSNSNGKIPNGVTNFKNSSVKNEDKLRESEETIVPFLNGGPDVTSSSLLPELMFSKGYPTVPEEGGRQELIVTFCADDENNDVDENCYVTIKDSYSHASNSDKNIKYSQMSPILPLENSQNSSRGRVEADQPTKAVVDSKLGPFPVVTDYSSTLSIVEQNAKNNSRNRDLIEATSSYENL